MENGRNQNDSSMPNRRIPVETRAYYKKRLQEEKRRKRKLIGKISMICGTIVLIGGVITAAAFIGMRGGVAADANTETQQSEIPAASVSPVSSVPESSIEESSEEEKTPKYSQDRNFELSLNSLSKETKKKLDNNLISEYIILYDFTEDKIIYSKNAGKKLYPASTTKLLTAIVASKIISEDTVLTVGDEITLIGPESSTAYLVQGMNLTFEMLLDALLLPSGNDAAYTIAVNAARIYTGNSKLSNEEAVNVFLGLMNDAADQLGCKNTHFVTPDGWHDDNHYTTAEDLAKIAAYARTVPLIKKSCSKDYAEWELINYHAESSQESSQESKKNQENGEEESNEPEYGPIVSWYNSNKLIDDETEVYSKFVDGMKTGFTDEAGSSVVASATVSGHTLIAVVMKGTTVSSKYNDANLLFKYGFDIYHLKYTFHNEKDLLASLQSSVEESSMNQESSQTSKTENSENQESSQASKEESAENQESSQNSENSQNSQAENQEPSKEETSQSEE